MRYVRLASDLHLDNDWARFHQTRVYDPVLEEARLKHLGRPWCEMDELWSPPIMEGDDDTLMILAGDIWCDGRAAKKLYPEGDTWIARVAKRFKHVILIYGNHDYWGRNLAYEPKKVEEYLKKQGLTNVTFFDYGVGHLLILEQLKLLGGTLWTDYKKHDPLVMLNAPMNMKDYGHITYGPGFSKLRPQQAYAIHQATRAAIFRDAKRDHPDQVVIVATHMAPSYGSVGDGYRTGHPRDELMNPLYYSSLEQEILDSDIDLWFHGHTHQRFDYDVGHCRVMCNARGYVGYENCGFDPHFRLDLTDPDTYARAKRRGI